MLLVSREEAIRLATAFYAAHGVTVVHTRDDLATATGDGAFVLLRAIHCSETPFVWDDWPDRFWLVSFEELERVPGGWTPPNILPSGGFVRVDEVTGEVYQPPIL